METTVLRGNPLAEARAAKGLTMRALADITEISWNTINRIEQGTQRPNPLTAKVLEQTLDLPSGSLRPSWDAWKNKQHAEEDNES